MNWVLVIALLMSFIQQGITSTCPTTCAIKNSPHHLKNNPTPTGATVCDPVPGSPMCTKLTNCDLRTADFTTAEVLVLRLQFSDLKFTTEELAFNYDHYFLAGSQRLGTFLHDNTQGRIDINDVDKIKPRFGTVAAEVITADTFSHSDVINCVTQPDGSLDMESYWTIIANEASHQYLNFAEDRGLWAVIIPAERNDITSGMAVRGKGVVQVGYSVNFRTVTRTWGELFGMTGGGLLRERPGCQYPDCARWAQINGGDTKSAMSVDPSQQVPDLVTHWPVHEKAKAFYSQGVEYITITPAGGSVTRDLYAHNDRNFTQKLYGIKIGNIGEYSYWLSYQYEDSTSGVSVYLTTPTDKPDQAPAYLLLDATPTDATDTCKQKWRPIHGGECRSGKCVINNGDTQPSCSINRFTGGSTFSYCTVANGEVQEDLCPVDGTTGALVGARCIFPYYDENTETWHTHAKFGSGVDQGGNPLSGWLCPTLFNSATGTYSNWMETIQCRKQCTNNNNRRCIFPYKLADETIVTTCQGGGATPFTCATEIDTTTMKATEISTCVPCKDDATSAPTLWCTNDGAGCKFPFQYAGQWYNEPQSVGDLGISGFSSNTYVCPTELGANGVFDPNVQAWGTTEREYKNNYRCKAGSTFRPSLDASDQSCFKGEPDCAGCGSESTVLTQGLYRNNYFDLSIENNGRKTDQHDNHYVTVTVSFPEPTTCPIQHLSGPACDMECPGGQFVCGGTSRSTRTACQNGACSLCQGDFHGPSCFSATLCDTDQVGKRKPDGEQLWTYRETAGSPAAVGLGVYTPPTNAFATEVFLEGRVGTLTEITVWGKFDYANAISVPNGMEITLYETDPSGAIVQSSSKTYIVTQADIKLTPPDIFGDIAITANLEVSMPLPGLYYVSVVVNTEPGVRWYTSEIDPATLKTIPGTSTPDNRSDMKWNSVSGQWETSSAEGRILVSFPSHCVEYYKLFDGMSLLIFGAEFPDFPLAAADKAFDWDVLYKTGTGGRITDWLRRTSNGVATIGSITRVPNVVSVTSAVFTTPNVGDPKIFSDGPPTSKEEMYAAIKHEVVGFISQINAGIYDPDKYDMYICFLPDFGRFNDDPHPAAFIKDMWISTPSSASPAVHINGLSQLALLDPVYYYQPETTLTPPSYRKNLVVNGDAERKFGADAFPWVVAQGEEWDTVPSSSVAPDPTTGGIGYFIAPKTVNPGDPFPQLYQDISLQQFAVGTKFMFSCWVRSGSTDSQASVILSTNVGTVWESERIDNSAGGMWEQVSWVYQRQSAMEKSFRITLQASRADDTVDITTDAFFDNVWFGNHPGATNALHQTRVSLESFHCSSTLNTTATKQMILGSLKTPIDTAMYPVKLVWLDTTQSVIPPQNKAVFDCPEDDTTISLSLYDLVISNIGTWELADDIGARFTDDPVFEAAVTEALTVVKFFTTEEHGTLHNVDEAIAGSNDGLRLAGAVSTDATGSSWLLYPSIQSPVPDTEATMWVPEMNVRDKNKLGWMAAGSVAAISASGHEYKLMAHNTGYTDTRAITLGNPTGQKYWLQYTYNHGTDELGQGLQIFYEMSNGGKLLYLDGTPYHDIHNCMTFSAIQGTRNGDDDDDDDDDNDDDHAMPKPRSQPTEPMYCNMEDTTVPVGSSIELGFVTIFVRRIEAPSVAEDSAIFLQIEFNDVYQCAVPALHGPSCAEQCPGGAIWPCNGNGVCNNGVCQCDEGWSGDACSINDKCEAGKQPGDGCGCDVDKCSTVLKAKDNNGLEWGGTTAILTPIAVRNPSHLDSISFFIVNTGGSGCMVNGVDNSDFCPSVMPDSIAIVRYAYSWTGCAPDLLGTKDTWSDTINNDDVQYIRMFTNPLLAENIAEINVKIPPSSVLALKTLWTRENGQPNYYYFHIKPIWNKPNGVYKILTEDITGGNSYLRVSSSDPDGCQNTLLPDYLREGASLTEAKRESQSVQYKLQFQTTKCNTVYKPKGIVVAKLLTESNYMSYHVGGSNTGTARVGERMTIHFNGLVVTSATLNAKIADNNEGFGCVGEAEGGESTKIDRMHFTAKFRLTSTGSYAVCVQIRDDWIQVGDLLEVTPQDEEENFYGFKSCAGVIAALSSSPMVSQGVNGRVCGCVFEQGDAAGRSTTTLADSFPFAYFDKASPIRILQGCCDVNPPSASRDFVGRTAKWDVCIDPDAV